jgi:DNA-binding MarR family transcriptional regulator
LVVLAEEGPAPQQTVGERIEIDKSTMVVVVDELEELGLVERRRNPQNRRAYELTLTETGLKRLSEVEPVVEEVEEAALAPLDEARRTQLRELLLSLLLSPAERHHG